MGDMADFYLNRMFDEHLDDGWGEGEGHYPNDERIDWAIYHLYEGVEDRILRKMTEPAKARKIQNIRAQEKLTEKMRACLRIWIASGDELFPDEALSDFTPIK